LAYTSGLGARIWQTVIPAGDRARLRAVVRAGEGALWPGGARAGAELL
jgi:hypothetical protein